MDCEGPKAPRKNGAFSSSLNFDSVIQSNPSGSSTPLRAEEVILRLRRRWKVTYDLQLVVRSRRLYLQMMWAYLEQQSFPLDEKAYLAHLNELVEVINRLGLANDVREWLACVPNKPTVGRPLSLPLKGDWRLEEFLL